LAVPLLARNELFGVISIWRREKRDFSRSQVAMVNTFATQAVIAIENARLFNETKDALERQTATSDVLSVIAASPADVQPVLDAVAERAARICGAIHSSVFFADGAVLRRKAIYGDHEKGVLEMPIRRTLVNGRTFLEKRCLHIPD